MGTLGIPREDGSISAVVSVDAAIGGPRKPAVGTEVVVTPPRHGFGQHPHVTA